MASRFCLFFSLVMLSTPLADERPNQIIIWNVGQGQWVTVARSNLCVHFDLGGEFAPWKSITELCRRRQNALLISHWDWDHVSFAPRLSRILPNHCLALRPLGPASLKKTRAVDSMAKCELPNLPFTVWSPKRGRDSNSLSHVVLWWDILIPGDSGRTEETLWVRELKNLERVKLLILGHHGSRTSTSSELLFRLPQLKQAVASSRKARYGHPHPEVLRALEERKIPLLSTEDWGTLHFYN